MTQPPKTQPGRARKATITRRWSKPIPDELLNRFEAIGFVVDDNDHHVIIYRAGYQVAAVWGPAVEGHWFAHRDPDNTARRVQSRDDGLRYALGDDVPEVMA